MYMPGYYEFCCRVNVLSGHASLESIPALLADLGARKPFIVTDRGVSGAGLLDLVTGALRNEVEIGAMSDEVPPDSDVEIVNRLAGVYRARGCDSIIAVGGGSVMDTAKGMNILVSERSDNLLAFSGANALKRPLKPFVAVPTTAGTGSEVTQAAVIKDRTKSLKLAFASYFLLPDAAVLDSRMTLTLPPALTASTGMDALTHAMEAYFCLAKNPLSDTHALAAVDLIGRHLLPVVGNPGDREGRLALANAATLAGIAFSNSMVGLVHNLGHATGSACGVPHGACMAMFLPYGLEYNLHKREAFMAELLLPLAGPEVYAAVPPAGRAQKLIDRIRQLNQDLHEATGGRHFRFLKEVVDREGKPMVPRERIPDIVAAARLDGAVFYNPEEMDAQDMRMVLEAAWEGQPLDRSRIKKG
jgi:alcohol dehydrogenase